MNKLPLIEAKKKKNKLSKNIFSSEAEDDQRKNNFSGNNYDIAINYYTKKINNDSNNTTFLIKRAICYLSKGYYPFALKDALRTIEIDKNFNKGYYIVSLCHSEMYDINMVEKYSENKNKRLKALIEKYKKGHKSKVKK